MECGGGARATAGLEGAADRQHESCPEMAVTAVTAAALPVILAETILLFRSGELKGHTWGDSAGHGDA